MAAWARGSDSLRCRPSVPYSHQRHNTSLNMGEINRTQSRVAQGTTCISGEAPSITGTSHSIASLYLLQQDRKETNLVPDRTSSLRVGAGESRLWKNPHKNGTESSPTPHLSALRRNEREQRTSVIVSSPLAYLRPAAAGIRVSWHR